NDAYIKAEGLARYDRDFRDSWTHGLAISWDLMEESGVFDDAERLANTNLLIRLGLECTLYQHWQGARVESWRKNKNIVHNHNTFPALGVYFVGTYMKRHYGIAWADDWLAVADGIFAGQKHSSKPLEDAASYQWLPILHTMLYGMARDDWTFFREGHARESAAVGAMVMDNAGYQAAFGDHSAYRASSALGTTLQRIAWQTRDPGILWAARRTVGGTNEHVQFNLGQPYSVDFAAVPPKDQRGAQAAKLPKLCYDYAARSPQYASKPNLPWPVTFDKLAFRAGFARDDEYLLLDGFGRGTHMHFDANAIIRFSAGGEPLLVDAEYIKNAPKYHNSLVILRDGQSVLTPAVTALRSLASFGDTAITRTELVKYNGADWERSIVWRPKRYVLVTDTVTARTAGDYTLRCCWRPWGEARLEGQKLIANHAPMRLELINADGAAGRLETMKTVERMAVSRLSQQVGRTMKPGDSYSFVNAFHAEPQTKPRQVSAQLLRPGVAVIDQPEGREVVAFGPGTRSLPGITTDASIVVLSKERLAVTDCQQFGAGGATVLSSTEPVSVEFEPTQGRAVIVTSKPSQLTLRGWSLKHASAKSAQGGGIVLDLPAGKHMLSGTRAPMPAWALTVVGSGSATSGASAIDRAVPIVPTLKPLWEHGGFDPAPEPLAITSVTCKQPHYDRYGPATKLGDGIFSSSTSSVMWPAGVTATVVLELAAETQLEQVVMREWHMNEDWDMGTRKLEISSDGFKRDVRPITAPFRPAGTQSWGNNTNSLFAAPVHQRAKQVRLTLSPARKDSRVYVAEVELHGVRTGALPAIRALAMGRLGETGAPAVV
ncbi:MAG: hypothetical protein HN380_29490, partial [Victivallales bacterium]|nr:hypothetical protein [Victivallales bacterium]